MITSQETRPATDDLILVKLDAVDHEKMMLGHSAVSDLHTEKQLPYALKQFFNRLRTLYGVTPVAYWPLGSVGVHCLLLREDRHHKTRD